MINFFKWRKVEKSQPSDGQYVVVSPPYVSVAFDDEPRHVLFYCEAQKCFNYYLGGSVHTAYQLREGSWGFDKWTEVPA